MASADAAKPPSLSEEYYLKGKEKPVEEAVKTPGSATVEESLAESAAVAAESTAVVESHSATAADESSKTSDAASGETTEAAPAVESTEATPASETGGEDESPASEEASESTESETVDDEAAAEDTPKIQLETAPADFRFPTTNQTRHCFTRYVEYHRCIAAKGDDAPECQKFAKYYRSLCPGEWIDRWNEQRESGTFPGPL